MNDASMYTGLDLSQFFDTFFDEADELLSEMEQLLVALDVDAPDPEKLNAIFRAAHSIKGGAATFGCFGMLADTTHLLENLLDAIRRGEIVLRQEMIDVFLEARDVLADQVAAYRNQQEPDAQTYEQTCARLRTLTEQGKAAAAGAAPVVDAKPVMKLQISRIKDKDIEPLVAEMALMGKVLMQSREGDALVVWLDTTTPGDDIAAVCCFIVDEDQVSITHEPLPAQAQRGGQKESATAATTPPAPAPAPATAPERAPVQDVAAQHETAAPVQSATAQPEPAQAAQSPTPAQPAASAASAQPAAKGAAGKHATSAASATPAGGGNSTIRVGVEKVDQIINLVGELVITQAMLVQTASALDPVVHDRLINGIEQLDRNARDLQEAVMSIRMVPMDYVFSRFPRVVREAAAKMGKRIRLVTQGAATELDKGLIERIVDPLTHLVRNSIDHGVESPERRAEIGKNPEGTIILAAQHHGGQIVIEVRDDGAGLNREKILKKAMSQGFPVNESTPDEELWPLIFAPGFSTAEKVTEISGRGVGMDVVRRNIQGMGGHIQILSRAGEGSTIRIVLPLTLAILDGMSVRVGDETFILPLSNVSESLQPTPDQIRHISETERVLHVRGDYLPVVDLHQVFDVAGAEQDLTRAIAVIMQVQDVRFALIVDHLIGQHQVVVKNLEANYRKVPGVSAATILGDGSVALIVDVFALMQTSQGQRPATV